MWPPAPGVAHPGCHAKAGASCPSAGAASPTSREVLASAQTARPGRGFSFGFRDATLEGKMHCKIGPENVLHFLCKYSVMYCIQYRY